MLELRPNCELCDRDLPPASREARICTYECTFCSDCVERVLRDVCPNCGGNFAPRPIRPHGAHRPGTGLGHNPPSAKRRTTKYDRETIASFAVALAGVAPTDR